MNPFSILSGVFGGNKEEEKKKKQPIKVIPPSPRQVEQVNAGLNKGQSWENIAKNSGLSLDSVRAYSQKTRPNYGIPQQSPIASQYKGITGTDWGKAANNVGRFFFQNPAKLANSGFATIEKAGVNLAGNVQGLWDKQGGQRTIREGEADINRRLLQNGKGLFGAGGLYDSLEAQHNASTEDVLKKAGGAGIETAANMIPVGKGIKLLNKAAPLANKVVAGAKTGLVAGAAGSAGNQLVNTGTVDPLETLKGAGAGALLGAATPVVGAGVQKGVQVARPVVKAGAQKAANAVDQAGIPKSQPHLRVPLEDRRELSDFVDMQMKRYNPSVAERNRLIKRAYEMGDKYGIDVRTGSNVDVQNRVADYLDSLNTARAYAKQGGYAKVPFKESGEADIAPHIEDFAQSVNKPDDIVNQSADYWYKHGRETKGGQMINTGDDQYKRISEHNQFYSDFMKQNKRAPSKADYQAEVTRQYENGGGSMVSPDEAQAYQMVKARNDEFDSLATNAERNAEIESVAQATQSNTPPVPRQRQESVSPTNQEIPSRFSQQSGQQTPLPDNTAQSGRSFPDNTPNIDTRQYVNEMGKAQKNAMKGESGAGAKARDFKEKFIDDLAPIEDRLNKAIKSGAVVDPKDHITYQLDRSRRAEGIMHAYVRDNGLDKIIQNVDNTKEFDQYLIARHARELDPEIRTGRDAAKDAALVRQFEGKYAVAAQELYKYNQKLLDSSVDYGLISKETAANLKKRYPEYVPFNRIFNEDELANLYGGAGKGNASLSKQTAVQKLKGSERAIASPLNSIIDKTRVVVEQGERNKAAQMLASYKDLPGNPFNLKEIPKGETIGARHTVSYLDKGVKRTFEVDKEIADAAKNMTRQEIGLWGRIAAVPARVLRGGATTVNVGFAGANVVKDVVGAAINSRHPFRIADPRAFGKALSAALHHNGKHYQELMREGVTGTSFDMYRNPLKSNVGEIRSQKNIATRALYNARPDRWFRTLENTIGRSEDFGRALQYYSNKSGFAKNNSDEVARILAADQARHNSTNFFRHGSYGKGINLAIPYWNAGVQGARIGIRRIKERPVQTLAKIGFVIAAPSATIAMNNYANEKNRQVMEEIPQYEKDGNIIIVGPDAKKNEETGRWEGVYKIPVPPQHIGIHKTIQDAVRAGVTGEAFDTLGNLGRITEDYTTINPTSLKETANRYIPQALKLAAEPMTNTNFFTGNKIVPDSQKNLPAADQYNDYTSGTAKTIGKLTNISPRQIDNAIRTGMGGAGQNLVNALDSGLAAAGVIEDKDVKGQTPLESITRRFAGAASINPSDKADKQFNDLKKQVIESDAYKKASQYDKSRMLNRLENDLSDVSWGTSGKSDTKLTKKQQELASEGFKLENYTNLDDKGGKSININSNISKDSQSVLKKYDDMSDDDRQNWFSTDPGGEYAYEKAKYENDKANGKISDIQDIRRKKELKKAEAGSAFDRTIRQLYEMDKGDVYDYVSTVKGGNKIVNELLAYGDALKEAGIVKSNKYKDKYGNTSLSEDDTVRGKKAKAAKGKKLSYTSFKLPTYSTKYRTAGAKLAANAKLRRKTSMSA